MYVDKSVFKSENDISKEATDVHKKFHKHKEEVTILNSKVENSVLDFDKEIVEEKYFQ